MKNWQLALCWHASWHSCTVSTPSVAEIWLPTYSTLSDSVVRQPGLQDARTSPVGLDPKSVGGYQIEVADDVGCAGGIPPPAEARNRRFGPLSALRAHTNAPGKAGLLWETLRAPNSPARVRTEITQWGR